MLIPMKIFGDDYQSILMNLLVIRLFNALKVRLQLYNTFSFSSIHKSQVINNDS